MLSTLNVLSNYEETVYDWDEKKFKPNWIRRIHDDDDNDDDDDSYNEKNIKNRKQNSNIEKRVQSNKIKKCSNCPGPWGYASTPLRNPCNYLKKNEGVRHVKEALHKCIVVEKKSKIPKRNEIIKFPEKPKKNYKVENIEMIKNGNISKRPITLKYVDSRTGTSHILSNSGHIPEYIYSKNFGKVPKYIIKTKELISKIKKKSEDEYDQNEQDSKGVRVKFISAEERLKLLEGMKKNLKELLSDYQKLPVCIDTENKRQRKMRLEKELNNLEKDIEFIESNPRIYVCET